MRAMFFSLALVSGIMAGASVAPVHAMTAASASTIEAALAEQNLLQDAAYVCRHRFYTSRRICWWRPSWRYWRR